MPKVHKVTLYVVDLNGDYDNYTEEEVAEEVKQHVDLQLDTMSHVGKIESSEEFEWDDELKINYTNATTKDYEEYFKKEGK
ncbi:hypothetical protein BigBertha_138 [Bacillus phage BigBertha]|uniref:Uncharacterized protein n=4 Tax=Caudoviricetes TaxID=2731619 RepID=A0A7U3T8R6_9CAUD|nr:hypothetical protein BigBertha_138 [Bacillus phage BigBertha]YP_009290019.1 hypothetical protein BI003_gp140 [Bacillus phage Phrodo]AMW61667.1 hypothetical protein JUGLONE_142 [Bacillus phage Juglone]QDH49837.1 hypothetical protein BEYONPHE_150 [Bacillus phage Beyonphe]QPY77375.1 hypothetical protein ANTHOS_139 [Bacillus phage Anthos]UGO48952.1 hypothetical protein JARJAR_138 [Bacillus phage vB_BanH_JarJar]UGO50442.1 hypothetical protein RONSWANSON_136 [Bacillus phage vB_BanH_RonSwanson]